MSDQPLRLEPVLVFPTDDEALFPTLTAAQLERLAAQGRVRQVERDEVVVEAGSESVRVFVVRSGTLELHRSTVSDEGPIAVLRAGQFTDEDRARRQPAPLR